MPLVPPVVIECPEVAFPDGYGDEPQVVVLDLRIDETGAVVVTGGDGPNPFLFLARAAAERCVFEPATEDGLAVAVEIPMNWRFEPAEPVPVEAPDAPEALGIYTRERSSGVVRTLTAEEIALAPGTLGDPVRAIQNLPGVVRTPFDAGWLLVRGGDTNDTGVTLDGVRIPLLFHLGGHTSVLHPAMVHEVTLHSGAPPARLGRATSGAVNLVPRELDGQGGVVAGLNTGYAHAFAEVPVAGGGLAIAARRSYLDGVLALVAGPGGADIAPTFSDVALRLDAGPFGLTAIGISDAARVPTGDDDEVADLVQSAAQVQARVRGNVGSGVLEARGWLAAQRQRAVTDTRDQQLDEIGPGGRLEWHREGDLDATVGIEAETRQFTVAWNDLTKSTPTAMTDPYAEVAFGADLRTRIGLRLDTLWAADQLPRIDLSPRGDVEWRLSAPISLVAEAGRFHMPPPMVFIGGLPDGPYLPLDRAHLAAAGLRVRGAPVSFDLDVWGRVQQAAGFEQDRSLVPRPGRAGGVEATLHHTTERSSARLVVQVSRSEHRDEDADVWMPTRYDQPLRLVGLWLQKLPRSWVLSGRARYGTGYPHTATSTSAYDVLQQRRRDIELTAAGRLPSYCALDLKASKRFEWQRGQLDVYLDVQNATNTRVPEPVINGIDEDVVVYGFGLPILPLFGVEGSFFPYSERQARESDTSWR